MSFLQHSLQVVTQTLLSCGYKGPTDLICQSLYDDFTDSQYWVIYDDVIDCLTKMKSMGLMIGAVSNFDERLSRSVILIF